MCSSESAKPGKCARAGGDSGAGASGQGTDKNWEQIRCVSKRGGLFEGDLSLAQLRQSAGYVRAHLLRRKNEPIA